MSFEDWLDQGRKLGLLGRSAGWWIGDWLAYGNTTYGERYVRAARVTGYDVQTLMNMVYVATHIDSARRRENLSWSHHAEVVALDPADQEHWLERAGTERLSVRCLRQEIRRTTRACKTPEQHAVVSAEPAAALETAEPLDDALVCPACGHALT